MKQLGSVLALGIALALSSCERTPETPSKDAEAAVPTPVDTAPAAPAAAPAAQDPAAAGPARLDGYGPLTLGSTLDEVRAAWKAPLQGEVPDDYCHALRPQGAQAEDVILMIEGKRLVRYDVRNDRITAPGGGKVGMSLGQLQTLYPTAAMSPAQVRRKGPQPARAAGHRGRRADQLRDQRRRQCQRLAGRPDPAGGLRRRLLVSLLRRAPWAGRAASAQGRPIPSPPACGLALESAH